MKPILFMLILLIVGIPLSFVTANPTIEQRIKEYDTLLELLQSTSIARRHAAFDAAFASENDNLKEAAIAAAMQSGDDGLQAKALAALIVRSPRIGITYYKQDKDQKIIVGNQSFEILEINQETLSFSGKYHGGYYYDTRNFNRRRGVEITTENNGIGSVQRDRLSLNGNFKVDGRSTQFNCSVNVRANNEGILKGTVSCDDDTFEAEAYL